MVVVVVDVRLDACHDGRLPRRGGLGGEGERYRDRLGGLGGDGERILVLRGASSLSESFRRVRAKRDEEPRCGSKSDEESRRD